MEPTQSAGVLNLPSLAEKRATETTSQLEELKILIPREELLLFSKLTTRAKITKVKTASLNNRATGLSSKVL